jgi:hypothetical protein
MGNDRGMVLGVVILTAVVFAIVAFGALTVALGGGQRAKQFHHERLRARYAAEAGVVWAMQQLWADPSWFSEAGGPPDFRLDDGTSKVDVDLVIPPCTLAPCENRRLEARVVY